MFKCAHISDIHFRSLKRHDEYRIIFENIFEKLNELKPDVIFIGGDIVHSKTQGITPELIDQLNWWFTSLANIAPTHIILGNHDGLILNESRQDAISPIINALNNKNIKLFKNSGTFKTGIDNVNWCIFSVFDKANWHLVQPIKNEINIACFHGAVYGSKTDVDWEIDGEVMIDMFKDYDFAFLGDIHKMQFLDQERRVAYPGSTIQQNYGEDVNKGFLFWEINNKHDYKSTFYSFENPYAFTTIDWQDDLNDTIKVLNKTKNDLRYRIRSNKEISQADIKALHHYLKSNKNAKEIVYQINDESTNSNKNLFDDNVLKSLSIKNDSQRIKLIKQYFENTISDQEIDSINSLFKKNLSLLENEDDYSYNNWVINNITFNNTFSYGKNNYINFKNLNGIVGLFGKNASGKSSIPGTLMYGLFNSSDRGLARNIDIINTRKGECNAIIDITVGTENYVIERETIKKTVKKTNESSATTKLKLLNKNKNNEISDETDEQRRDTEKVLRKLIGTSEDFLYTSFASQGNINSFIEEKSTARKSVISKFLNLDIFEELLKVSKEEYSALKYKIKNYEEKNWLHEINYLNNQNLELNTEHSNNNELKIKLRENEINKRIELNNLINNVKKHSSGYTKTSAENEFNLINEEINNTSYKIKESSDELETLKNNVDKINLFKSNFPKESLENDKIRLDTLKDKLFRLDTILNNLNKEKQKSENDIKILYDVPCEDKFTNCKFIKNAYETKLNLPQLNQTINETLGDILEVKNTLTNLVNNDIESKLKKYNEIINKEYKFQLDIEKLNDKIDNLNQKLNTLNSKKQYLENLLIELNDFEDEISNIKEKNINNEINEITNKIVYIEKRNKEILLNVFNNEKDIETLTKEKNEFERISKQWSIYSKFIESINKKGIPTMLINSYLPKINKEINKILNGVVEFKVEICDDNNNNLNIFIDYGDSKRIIECCSGMEKMISSLAIRVALINISSLSKTNIFIIDEGFGALDSSNIEACNKLLHSLKKYFKTILVISHIDSIKDIVDKSIEITSKGNDSYVRFN